MGDEHQTQRQTVENSVTATPGRPTNHVEVDVLIIGSGPIGAAYARKLVEAGRKVFMIDAGAMESRVPGEHLKNAFVFQRGNIDAFSSVVRSHLQTLSFAPNNNPEIARDPAAFRFDPKKYVGFVQNGQNPNQDPRKNLDAAAATYAVGGMATHWTCAMPEHHPTIERYRGISDDDWTKYYAQARTLLNTHTDQYDKSIRHRVVLETLRNEFSHLPSPYDVQPLPLAVERRRDNDEFVTWSSTATLFGPLARMPLDADPFILKGQHRCKRLIRSADGKRIDCAEVEDLMEWKTIYIKAGTYILAAGHPHAAGAVQLGDPPGTSRSLSLRAASSLLPDLCSATRLSTRSVPTGGSGIRLNPTGTGPGDPVPIPIHDPEPQV